MRVALAIFVFSKGHEVQSVHSLAVFLDDSRHHLVALVIVFHRFLFDTHALVDSSNTSCTIERDRGIT